ncbi:MAG: MATE family efflux transporter [Planctomycetia bacterium]|nr:MATE family efflux transporter [Planctomycetia bacterium]
MQLQSPDTDIRAEARSHWSPFTSWSAPGGGRELLRIAVPLIVSNSVWTLQITLDRMMLSWLGQEHVGAAMTAVMLFWTPLALFQTTAGYSTTFVAQYLGAGRPERVGPAVWQALWFSLVAGIGFLAFIPSAETLVSWGDHSPHVQQLEAEYFYCLCFSALPTMIVAAASGFFAGRGDSWTVLLINVVGLVVNGVLDYLWIFGHGGFPALGIVGAGWATVVGTGVSAAVAVALLFQRKYREEFQMLAGWRFEADLFNRLMRYGLPSGLQWALEGLAWTGFLFMVGRLGDAELAASSIAFTLNAVAFMPTMGIGQAIQVLVGQRLGQDQPRLAERTVWTGLGLAMIFMVSIALLYLLTPGMFLFLFESQSEHDAALRLQVAAIIPVLLQFIAVYSLFDGMNLVFAFALKGAGDTRFVTVASVGLAWPLMVVPSWAAWHYGWGLYWAWTFASTYIVVLAWVLFWRFRGGRWQEMRVIETGLDREPATDHTVVSPVEEGISCSKAS